MANKDKLTLTDKILFFPLVILVTFFFSQCYLTVVKWDLLDLRVLLFLLITLIVWVLIIYVKTTIDSD